MPDPILTGINDTADIHAIARFIYHAFTSAHDQAITWIEGAGHQNFRILRDQGKPVACLVRIPMGQYFGGRSVSLLGIAAVAVPPESRGNGYAKRMMQLAMQEAAADGFGLSGLYASTQTLYRQIGFEQAAHRFRIEIGMSWITERLRAGAVEPLSETDIPGIHACYAAMARVHDGFLDRGDYIWKRIRNLRGTEFSPFGVRNPAGGLDGYFYLSQQRRPDSGRHNLELSDLVFTTPEAARRLLGLLADFGSMAEDLGFYGGPTHPALLLLPQQRHRMSVKDTHLNRILDLKSAIAARGFNPTTRGEVHFDVSDPLIPANNGKFIITVENGKATATPGGSGAIQLTINALASIYCGFVTPTQAAILGWAHGTPKDLLAANIFCESTPWLTDMY
ncbi:MAG: GNAT family N-acetyltransferase [Phycisphaerales bacterium]|nr:GNAT family N-acetyltransferase [Phycisphaerales bacterium]